MKKLLITLLFGLLFLSSCNMCDHVWNEPTCNAPKTCEKCNETKGAPLGHEYFMGECVRCKIPDLSSKATLKFSKDDKLLELQKLEVLLIGQLDKQLKQDVMMLFSKSYQEIKNANKTTELDAIKEKYLKDIYDLIPEQNGRVDFTSLNDSEKQIILSLMDEYIFRNFLGGIPINKYYTLNLNQLTEEKWIEWFGENGIIFPNQLDNYWHVKEVLSNEYFIKGLSHAINKEKIEMTYLTNLIDYEKSDFFKHDLTLSKRYFQAAILELTEQGVFDLKAEPIEINLEIAFDLESEFKASLFNSLKEMFESSFNDNDVSNGIFRLTVNPSYSEIFGSIFYDKNYRGHFDLSFDKISGTTIDTKPYKDYMILSTHKELSKGFNINFSIDTNELRDDCIVYNGYKYSYDAILSALIESSKVENGKVIFEALE